MNSPLKRSLRLAVLPALFLLSLMAYLLPAGRSALASLLSYPFLGLGHLIAAAAVGVWGARLGGYAILLLPTGFILGASLGIALGYDGTMLLPLAKPMTWISALVLVFAAEAAGRLPRDEPIGVATLFGIFHGQVFGSQLGAVGIS